MQTLRNLNQTELNRRVCDQGLDHKLCGLILSGSNYAKSAKWRSAAYIAKFERWRLGPRNPSPLLEKMSFGSFNNAFKPARTPSDWLSRDDAMVDAYIAI